MKNKTLTYLGFALMLAAGPLPAQETAATRLEKGVELMRDERTLREAIRQFEGVLRAERQSDKLAAEARYHLAKCYLQLGDTTRASSELEQLRDGWPVENPWVMKSSKLMPEPELFGKIPWKTGEFLVYEIRTPDGKVVGTFCSAVVASEEAGQDSWTAWTVRGSGGMMTSRIEFLADNYRPVNGRATSPMIGDLILEVDEDGAMKMTQPGADKVLVEGKPIPGGWSAAPFYENDETLHLMRMLPTEVGTKIDLQLTTALLGGTALEFKLEATGHEKIETDAGSFDCVKYKTNINQDFWIERSGSRRIIRMGMGAVDIDLVSIDENWNRDQPTGLNAEKFGIGLTMPAGLVCLPVADNKKIYRMAVADSEFRIREGMIEIQPTANFLENVRDSEDALMDLLVKNFSSKVDEGGEVAGSRKILEAGGSNGVMARMKLNQGKLEGERSILVSHAGTTTTVVRFDHGAAGAEDAAAMLESIFCSMARN